MSLDHVKNDPPLSCFLSLSLSLSLLFAPVSWFQMTKSTTSPSGKDRTLYPAVVGAALGGRPPGELSVCSMDGDGGTENVILRQGKRGGVGERGCWIKKNGGQPPFAPVPLTSSNSPAPPLLPLS